MGRPTLGKSSRILSHSRMEEMTEFAPRADIREREREDPVALVVLPMPLGLLKSLSLTLSSIPHPTGSLSLSFGGGTEEEGKGLTFNFLLIQKGNALVLLSTLAGYQHQQMCIRLLGKGFVFQAAGPTTK